ncbi:nucleotidyltransferase substrate binding protein [Rhodothermus marinus]|jgi:hypothetical protein|uniref:nucleotidyltransferase substrate binding protein n=1 Tax=Rhodothermus marinus TaxID=29549 RepID=UPI001D1C09B7|nr:nucleotidyltransferase substrate binding protein [Rhodothermus marinus]MBO2491261.1 hypothetical protein [Rhodothermus marinus]
MKTLAQAKARFEAYVREMERHLQRLRYAWMQLGGPRPLTKQAVRTLLEQPSQVALLDQIVYRFAKMQDAPGRMLRWWLYLKGEPVESMSMIDMVNQAARLGLPIDEETWFKLRALRNALAHEYEEDPASIAQVLNQIAAAQETLVRLFEAMKRDQIASAS